MVGVASRTTQPRLPVEETSSPVNHTLVGSIPRTPNFSLDRSVQMKTSKHETCQLRVS